MHIQHPLYPRIVFACTETHPAIRQMAAQRTPAYESLRQALRERGFASIGYEEDGCLLVNRGGETEMIPYWMARQLTEERV
jgi:hypothetical protein